VGASWGAMGDRDDEAPRRFVRAKSGTGSGQVAIRRDDGRRDRWMDDGRGEATAATAYMDEVQVPAEGLVRAQAR
jgi:hypothetical protein